MKEFLKKIVPYKVRLAIWSSLPKFQKLNTYVLKNPSRINELSSINNKYIIREIEKSDFKQLIKLESYRSNKIDVHKIEARLMHFSFIGLGVFDVPNNKLAYASWIVTDSIPYFEEFGIFLGSNDFFLKDIFVVPNYRRQGLNQRMEQERINYCVKKGAKNIFIQIHDSHPIMNNVVKKNGYNLLQQNLIIRWPIFNIYRSLKGFLRNPFKKIIK